MILSNKHSKVPTLMVFNHLYNETVLFLVVQSFVQTRIVNTTNANKKQNGFISKNQRLHEQLIIRISHFSNQTMCCSLRAKFIKHSQSHMCQPNERSMRIPDVLEANDPPQSSNEQHGIIC